MRRMIPMAALLFSLAGSLSAATWYVANGGSDVPGAGTSLFPFQTLSYAVASASDGDSIELAAGIYNEYDVMVDRSVTIRGAGRSSTFVDAGFSGTGLFLYGVGETIVVEDLSIINGAGRDGGGVLNVAARSTLRRCNLVGNYSGYTGGGARNQYGTLRLTQCHIVGNTAWWYGGGAYNCEIDSSLLEYNAATNGGGAVKSILRNCTVVTNTAEEVGGLLDCTAYNSICYGNGATVNGETEFNYKDTVFEDSLAWPLPEGSGNIDYYPVFIADGVNHREFITSPCINRGNPAHVVGTEDLDGHNRQFDGLPDMGAFEFTAFHIPARIQSLSGTTNYGIVQVLSASTGVVWVLNKGNDLLTVSEIETPAGFTATMADPTVEAGQSNAVQVVFAPGSTGAQGGWLTVASDLTWGALSLFIAGVATPAPALDVQPASLSASAIQGAVPEPLALTVRNATAGSGQMAFQAVSDQAWLQVAPVSGVSSGNTVTLQAVFDSAALSAGTYAATVTVSAAAAQNGPVRVPVTLTVQPQPVLEVSAAALSAAVPVGVNATSQVVYVRNGAAGDLAFTVQADDGEWEPLAPGGAPWLSVSPAGGSSSGAWIPVTVSFHTANLPNGEFRGTVRVMTQGGGQVELPVTLAVGTPYVAGSADPADWHVAVNGHDDTGDGSVANPFATVARALAAASDGQVIQLSTGVFQQAGIALRKSVTLRGAGWSRTILEPPAATLQDWEGRLFFAEGVGVSARLENLWLRNGRAHAGAALLASGATVELFRCRLSGHQATLDGGGAVRNLNGEVRLDSCILDRNESATSGGAAYGCDLRNSLVAFNSAASGGGVSGGTLDACTVAMNEGGGAEDAAVTRSIVIFNEGGNLSGSPATHTFSSGDPFFEDKAAGQFHLDLVSSALNSEAPAADLPALDLFARPRVVGLLPDLGALEKQYVVPVRRLLLSGDLSFGEVAVGTDATQSLWVANTGNTNVSVTAIEAPAGFAAVPAAFAVPALSSARVDVVFAPADAVLYTGALTVRSDAVNDPVSIPVSGTGILPPPVLGVSPLTLSVSCVEGSDAPNAAFTLANLESGAMAFTATPDVGWITPVPASGTTTGVVVTLAFNTSSLLYGTYEGHVEVAAPAATNSPLTVTVLLTVLPGQPPSQPQPLDPIGNEQVLLTNAVPFTWTRAARAEAYQVWVGSNGAFFATGWTTGESATNLTLTAPFRLGVYDWMVIGSNGLGYGAWSATGTFKMVRQASPSGGVILPVGTAPVFSWTETPGVTQYELEVQKKNAQGSSVSYASHSGAAPAGSWSAPALYPKGAYRWRLRETVDGSPTAWDTWYYFQVGVPASPLPVSPKGTLTLWKNVTFRWEGVTGATGYQMEILAGGNRYYLGPWQNSLSETVALLSYPATYKWRVRARNASGFGPWSSLVKVVRVNPQAPVNLYPNGTPFSSDSLVTFQWDPVEGATRYEIALYRGDSFMAGYKLYGVDSRTYTASAPFPSGAYTWFVRAGSDSWGPWSAPAVFTVP